MPDPVILWWACLSVAAVVNIVAWTWAFMRLRGQRGRMPYPTFVAREHLAWLSAAYVAGCAFRSFLPMVDVPRICLADLAIGRIAVGRSVATIAELCFIAQWAWLLREAAMATGARSPLLVSHLLLPLILLAELSSWHAVLTRNYFSHLLENSLWTVAAMAVLMSLRGLWPMLNAPQRRWFGAVATGAIAYIGFMLSVDLPMYYQRWQADLLAGPAYLTLSDGMQEVLARCVVNREWAAWRADVAWLTLYFTVAVWSSIALMHFPGFNRRMTLG